MENMSKEQKSCIADGLPVELFQHENSDAHFPEVSREYWKKEESGKIHNTHFGKLIVIFKSINTGSSLVT